MCPLQLWTYIWSLELYDASSANIALWLHARVSPRPASNYSYGDPLISIIKASKRNINMLRCWIMLREGLKKVKIWWNFPSSGWPSPPPPMMENSVKSQSGTSLTSLMNILHAECSSDADKTDEHSTWRMFIRRRHVQSYRCYRI